MKFGPLALARAEGAILAHSLKGAEKTHRKGAFLTIEDVSDLAAAGFSEVIAAQLELTDVHEDVAATRISEALMGTGLRASKASTGRVNLYATGAGVVEIDVEAIAALNSVEPMITVATVPDYHRTDPDAMVATIKIISYAVPEAAVAEAERAAPEAIRLRTPVYRSAVLIETRTDEATPPPKGRYAMIGRLDRFGVGLADRVVVPHKTPDIAAAIAASSAEVVLILTASATSDPHDVAPEAVRQAGGAVERFGMPVDPGNLLFLGCIDKKPVIGLPGCARSPALNGADWVLERILCGIEITSADIAVMGVGGLLKETPMRPRPREG